MQSPVVTHPGSSQCWSWFYRFPQSLTVQVSMTVQKHEHGRYLEGLSISVHITWWGDGELLPSQHPNVIKLIVHFIIEVLTVVNDWTSRNKWDYPGKASAKSTEVDPGCQLTDWLTTSQLYHENPPMSHWCSRKYAQINDSRHLVLLPSLALTTNRYNVSDEAAPHLLQWPTVAPFISLGADAASIMAGIYWPVSNFLLR